MRRVLKAMCDDSPRLDRSNDADDMPSTDAAQEGWGGGAMGYSKFEGVRDKTPRVPSRIAMFIIYFPATVVYALMHASADRADVASSFHTVVGCMIIGHFAKRCLEVLFLHKYSGFINVATMCMISVAYTVISGVFAVTAIHRLAPSAQPAEYEHGSLPFGSLLWMVGQMGNCYHHWLLSQARCPFYAISHPVPPLLSPRVNPQTVEDFH